MRSIGNRIRDLRRRAGMSADDLAAYAGVDRATIFRYETGDIDKVPVSVFQKIASALNVDPVALMDGEEVVQFTLPIMKQKIPLIGAIHAGEPTFAEESFESYIEVGASVRCDFALRVIGDSMVNIRVQDGDIVFIRKQDTIGDGEIAAVLIDDEAALKRIRYLPNNIVMLQAENPKYAPIYVGGADETRDVRILGKAIAFQSNIR